MNTTEAIRRFFSVSSSPLASEEKNKEFIGAHLDKMVDRYLGETLEKSTIKRIVEELLNELRELGVPADTWRCSEVCSNEKIIDLNANQELYYHFTYSLLDNDADGKISYIGKRSR